MNTDFIRRVADWLALACLAAMVSVPFLHARHYNPIPSFWSEWWAFTLGLAAAALLLIRPNVWRPFGLPAVAAIPLVFIVTALVQYFAGRWYFIEPWLIYAAYLLWASLMMLAARSFVARRGLTPLADVLAAAILFGALANTAAAALQFHNVGFRSGWVFIRIANVPYSNLGQPNHFNHELWLGIASLYYLHVRERCRLSIVVPALLLLLFAATMSTSKSILLYAVALTLLSGFMRWKLPGNVEAKKLWRLTLPLLPVVLLLQVGVDLLGIAGDASLPTATQRLFNQVAGYQIRWRLAQSAWDVFLHAPLLGSGIGTLPWHFFISNGHFPLGQGPAVAEHTHNLLLQLLAEFGIVPVVIMVAILIRWVLAIARQPWRAEQWWLVALLGICAIHSMLEYPLWYSFFLGIAALLLGASDQPAAMLNNGRRGAVLSALIVATGVAPLVMLRLDYTQLENRFNGLIKSSSAGETWKDTMADMLRIQRDSLLAPYVMLSLSAAMELNDKELPAKVEVCKQAILFAPSHKIVFKCAALMAMKGESGDARILMEQSLQAYPKEAKRVAAELEFNAKTHAELTPLAAMAKSYAVKAKLLP
jgi:O-antigen ligase